MSLTAIKDAAITRLFILVVSLEAMELFISTGAVIRIA